MDTYKRIDWIDSAKGFAILSVIVGHTLSTFILRGMIFSFHMPLFFILSGYTSKSITNKENLLNKLKNTFKSLIIPAYIIFFTRLILLPSDYGGNSIDIKNYLYSVLYTRGIPIKIMGVHIPSFGMMWFLVVLFIIRNLHGLMEYKFSNPYFITIISIIMSFIGISRICPFLPFSFDIVLTAMIFYDLGHNIRKINITKYSNKLLPICFFIWIITLYIQYKYTQKFFEFTYRKYPMFPLCHISAIAGSMSVIAFFAELSKKIKNKMPLSLIGKYSMIIFVIHAYDKAFYKYMNIYLKNDIILSILRSITIIAIFYLILFIKNKLHKKTNINL